MNKYRGSAGRVIDEFFEAQENLKSYIFEGLSRGLSIEEVYNTLDEASPINRRDFLKLGATVAAQMAAFGGLTAGVAARADKRDPEAEAKFKEFNDRMASQRRGEAEANRRDSQAQMAAYNKANPHVYSDRSNPSDDDQDPADAVAKRSARIKGGMLPGVPPVNISIRKKKRNNFFTDY